MPALRLGMPPNQKIRGHRRTSGRGDAAGRRARRGTVLLMVVAMLSMLFVVGVALLTTVTFETGAIAGATRAKQQTSVINRLSREVRAVLRQGFVGNDGKPYNRDAPSLIGADTYGEIPGVHPMLASLEPHDATGAGQWHFYAASDLELALSSPPIPLHQAANDGSGIRPGTNLVHINFALGQDNPIFTGFDPIDETEEGSTRLRDDTAGGGQQGALFRRDADGDGVWDSYEYELPLSRFPASVRGDLADQLRADDNVLNPEAIYYAIRVIPHGAMVDVGHAHQTLLDAALGAVIDMGEAGNVAGPYVPEGEEVSLRRRFLLPPRNLPLSSLQSHPSANGAIPHALYESFVNLWGDFDSDLELARWWPIDTGQNGDLTGNPEELGQSWLHWMDPIHVDYDYRHLITTASHDDQLMRIGRDPLSPNGDWIEDIIAAEAGPPQVDNFDIDEWPDTGAAELLGRLKVSLPGLVKDAMEDEGLTYPEDLDVFLDLDLSNDNYERFVYTIQDAFTLMLRNVESMDTNQPALEIRDTAAALTANLIDFMDSDDVPTAVPIRDLGSGIASTNPVFFVFGLERQPYITEIYLDQTNGNFLVELFNPHSDSASLSLYQTGQYRYKIGTPGNVNGDRVELTGSIVSPGFLLVGVDNSNLAGGTPFQLDQDLTFGLGAIVQLLMEVDGNLIVVDEMAAPSGELSNQRQTTDSNPWFAPIARSTEDPTHSLGSHLLSSPPAGTYPVEVQFANTGVVASTADVVGAFPTTGSLLLLMRYGNHVRNSPLGGTFTLELASGASEIDNGRMPVFDQDPTQLAHDPQADPNDPLGLYIPWGQLVFDYFTALPLQNDPGTDDVEQPLVDQNGLRVHGRIDINAAPWTVLAGLPMIPAGRIPAPFRAKIKATANLDANDAFATPIGPQLAKSIVAYREARPVNESPDFGAGRRLRTGPGAPFSGFLTVGELANVRPDPVGSGNAGTGGIWDIDSGVINNTANIPPYPNPDYVNAVAVLVALGDWVTTRSQVFTIYGTLRGGGEKSAVDQKAIRFQETVDRLPCAFSDRLPRRIGPRVVGPYAQASRN